MKNVIKLDAKKPIVEKRKRVCAYARVSMETERLHHSLSAQISYYNKYISSRPDWEFAGIYADEGISGTTTQARLQFTKMLEDCDKGLIDLILCKSISRFARNTLDVLSIVRSLREKGIEVYFEKEKIASLSGDGELMLTLLASFAEEESRSISNNVKWSVTKRFKEGMPNGRNRAFGYRWEGYDLIPVPEEAEIVRYIYAEYLAGKSRTQIFNALNAANITTMKGKKYGDSIIKQILTNITYSGSLLFQKEYVEDPITKKRRKNRGELPQYLVENHHEPIISPEDWQRVQAEMVIRRDYIHAYNNVPKTCFTAKIKCPICGKNYRQSGKRQGKDKAVYYVWVCLTKSEKGAKSCNSKIVPEREIKKACCRVLGIDEFDEKLFSETIEKIVVIGTDTLEFHFYDGRVEPILWKSEARQECWTEERRIQWGEYQRQRQKKEDK